MANQQYPVEVQPDFLKKITGAKPVQALAELIWNGLDADASEVAVSFDYNELDTLSQVIVRDNGTGIVGCCRFQRHLVKVEDETGGGSWEREGNSAESSSLKQSSW